MAININAVVLVGNITRDFSLKHTAGGTAVCEFSMALNSREKGSDGEWGDRVDFFDVTVWGNQAESCAQYLGKGSLVGVSGRLRLERWKTKDDENRSKVMVVAEAVQFLNRKPDEERSEFVPAASSGQSTSGGDDFDDDIPF